MFHASFQRIVPFILGGYLWLMMIMLGSIVVEALMLYPSIFYNDHRSRIAHIRMASAVRAVLDRGQCRNDHR